MQTEDESERQLLAQAQTKHDNRCHICDERAHFRVQLGKRGHFACAEHTQLVVEDVVRWVTGVKLRVESAASFEEREGASDDS